MLANVFELEEVLSAFPFPIELSAFSYRSEMHMGWDKCLCACTCFVVISVVMLHASKSWGVRAIWVLRITLVNYTEFCFWKKICSFYSPAQNPDSGVSSTGVPCWCHEMSDMRYINPQRISCLCSLFEWALDSLAQCSFPRLLM